MTDRSPDGDATGHDLVEAKAGLPARGSGPTALGVVRGVAGMAMLWGGGWAAINAAFSFGLALLTPWNLAYVLPSALGFGIWGVLCGGAFASMLTVMERRKSLDDLSLVRAGLWGGLGAFGIVFLVIMLTGILPIIGPGVAVLQGLQGAVLGALSAVGTLWMAKSAPDDD